MKAKLMVRLGLRSAWIGVLGGLAALAATAEGQVPGTNTKILKPLTGPAPKMASPAPPIRRAWNGLHRANAGGDDGGVFPSDVSIAATRSQVLQVAGSALRLTDRGAGNAEVRALNGFFNAQDESPLFQAKVFYDRMDAKIFLTALSVDREAETSAIHFAFANVLDSLNLGVKDATNQPERAWCTYRIPITFGAGLPAYAGKLGFGQNESWLALTADNFRFNDDRFRTATLHVIDRDSLSFIGLNEFCPSLEYTRVFLPRRDDGTLFAGLQPVEHYDNNPLPGRPLFLVSSDPSRPSDVYTLWRLTGNGLEVELETHDLRGDFRYAPPPAARQKNGPALDTGDARITRAVYRNGRVWAVQATRCRIRRRPDESCVRLLGIRPTPAGGRIVHQENLGQRNVFFWAPGVAVNFDGDVLVPFHRSQNRQFLTTGISALRAGTNGFSDLRNLVIGKCPLQNVDDVGRNRTSTAVGIEADANDDNGFWIGADWSAGIPGLGCDWRTRIALVRDAPPRRDPPISLADGLVSVPTSQGPNSPNFATQLDATARLPGAGLADTAGRVLVLALRDRGRPDEVCSSSHHPTNCAAVDYPRSTPTAQTASWVELDLAGTRRKFYLTEASDLSPVPDPAKPK